MTSTFTGKFYNYKNNLANRKIFASQLSSIGYTLGETYGDGNCQFYAIAEQVFPKKTTNSPIEPESESEFEGPNEDYDVHLYSGCTVVRNEVCDYIKQNEEQFSLYLDTDESSDIDCYISEMSEDGSWGDNLTLQAASDLYDLEIVLFRFTGKKGMPFQMRITPQHGKPHTRTIYLAYWMDQHYDVIIKNNSNNN